MSESHPAKGMALPELEYKKLTEALKHNKSIKVKDAKGVEHKFYKKGDTIYADFHMGLVRHTNEVFNVAELARQDTNSFRNAVRRKMKADHPEWDEEELDIQADVISEANESIKRLMAMGVGYEVAVGVVKHTLNSDTIEEEVKNIRTLLANES